MHLTTTDLRSILSDISRKVQQQMHSEEPSLQ